MLRAIILGAFLLSGFFAAYPARAVQLPELGHHPSTCEDVLRKNVKLSVVVPVYRDLRNLVNLIDSLIYQENVDMDSFEMVSVVNNTEDIAQNVFSDIRQENQDTIALLRYIGGEAEEPVFVLNWLTERERAICLEARAKGLRITVLDFSTAGITRNLGLIRSLGIENVQAQFGESPRHIVAWMDADSTLPPLYVSTLLEAFNNEGLQAAFVPLRWRLHGGSTRAHYRTTLHDRLGWAYGSFKTAFYRSFFMGLDFANGPTIIATLETMIPLLRNMKKNVSAEDAHAARALTGFCEVRDRRCYLFRTIYSIPVTSVDRARYDSFAGAGRKAGIQINDGMDYETYLRAKDHVLDPAAEILRVFTNSSHDLDKGRVHELFDGLEVRESESWDDFMVRFFRKNLKSDESNRIRTMIDLRAQQHNAQSLELKLTVANLIKGNRANFIQSKHEFLEGNVWLEPRIQSQLQKGIEADTIFKQLENEFAEWFLPFDQTQFMKAIIQYEVLSQVIHEAFDSPAAYPSLHHLLEVLGGRQRI